MGNYELYHTFAESFCQPAITKSHTALPLPVCFLSHFSFALFHCLHFYFSLHSPLNYRPQRIDQHPAEACCQRDGGEAHFADQQPREDDSQRDVARRTDERDGHLPDAVKIASECVAGEAERVEKRHELQIVARILKRRAAARPEHKADRRARANVHDERHRKPHRKHQKKAAAKRFLHALFFPCSPILCHEHGGRSAAAVAKRVGKALDARRRRVGRDHVRAAGVDRALHQELSGVQARLVQRRDEAKMRRLLQ